MKSNLRFLVLWALIIGGILIILSQTGKKNQEVRKEIAYSDFIRLIEEQKIADVQFEGESLVTGKFVLEHEAGGKFETHGATKSEFVMNKLHSSGVTYSYKDEPKPGLLQTALVSWLPIFAIIFIFFLFMRQLQSGSSKALSFGQSRAKLFNENQSKVRFTDVAGCDEAKEELQEVVEFLKNPKKFTKLGGRIPKGALLVGPPGTGKTLLAKAVAGEASVPFFSISGSDFVEMFVGVGASRVRSLFENAKRAAPCLVFIDEIDAVGRHRGAGLGGGHDEREQTLNQLLVEMDGFEGTEGIIILAATNRADVLDPALLRPGRFDRRVTVNKPDLMGRFAILKVHTKKTPVSTDVNLKVIAQGTPGFAGADLENLVNEAALNAARYNRDQVTMVDFDHAKDKVSMGSARRSMIISPEEKKHTAYHEAGHALVGKMVPGNDPVHKVTIIPRGPALGVTMTLPTEDRFTLTKDKADALLAFLMGGRVAEEVVFGHLTTGASNDIERATELARKMVTEWGMSEKLGPVNFGSKNDNVFLGRDMSAGQNYSEETGRLIDSEVRAIVEKAHARAKGVLKDFRPILNAMAEALLERETIDADDIQALVDGRPLKELVIDPLPDQPDKKSKTPAEHVEENSNRAAAIIDLQKPVKT